MSLVWVGAPLLYLQVNCCYACYTHSCLHSPACLLTPRSLPAHSSHPPPAQDLRGKLADHSKEVKKVAKQLLDVQQRIPQASWIGHTSFPAFCSLNH